MLGPTVAGNGAATKANCPVPFAPGEFATFQWYLCFLCICSVPTFQRRGLSSFPVHFFPDISYRPLAVAWPVHFSTSLWLILVSQQTYLYALIFESFPTLSSQARKDCTLTLSSKNVTVNICSAYGIPSLRCPQIMNHQVRDLPPPPERC